MPPPEPWGCLVLLFHLHFKIWQKSVQRILQRVSPTLGCVGALLGKVLWRLASASAGASCRERRGDRGEDHEESTHSLEQLASTVSC